MQLLLVTVSLLLLLAQISPRTITVPIPSELEPCPASPSTADTIPSEYGFPRCPVRLYRHIQSDFATLSHGQRHLEDGLESFGWTNTLISHLSPGYIQSLPADVILRLLEGHQADISSLLRVFNAANNCSRHPPSPPAELRCMPDLAYQLTSRSPEPLVTRWSMNVGFKSLVAEAFRVYDFEPVRNNQELFEGVTPHELDDLYRRNVVSTHMMHLINDMSSKHARDRGLCRYIVQLLPALAKRDPSLKLLSTDFVPWTSCIIPEEVGTVVTMELILNNLAQAEQQTRRQTIASLANMATQGLDELQKIKPEVSYHVARLGSEVGQVDINSFIRVVDVLFEMETNWRLDPAGPNPLQLQVYEAAFVASQVNPHRSHIPLGKLLPNLLLEDLTENGGGGGQLMQSQLEYIVKSETYHAQLLSPSRAYALANTFFNINVNQKGRSVADTVNDLNMLVSGLSFDRFKAAVGTQHLDRLLNNADFLPLLSRVQTYLISRKVDVSGRRQLPVRIISQLPPSQLKTYLLERLGEDGTRGLLASELEEDAALLSEAYHYMLNGRRLTPQLAVEMGAMFAGASHLHIEHTGSATDTLDLLRIYASAKKSFSRSEAQWAVNTIRRCMAELKNEQHFNVQQLEPQDLYFLPAETFAEMEESELRGIDSLACETIFNRLPSDYLRSLPKERMQLLARVFLANCRRREDPALTQREADILREVVCYLPLQQLQQLPYDVLSESLHHFSRCPLSPAQAQCIRGKLHLDTYVWPKRLHQLGVNSCPVFNLASPSAPDLLLTGLSSRHLGSSYLPALLHILHQSKQLPQLDAAVTETCMTVIAGHVHHALKSHPILSAGDGGGGTLCKRERSHQPAHNITCPLLRALGWGNKLWTAHHVSLVSGCELKRCSEFIGEHSRWFTPGFLRAAAQRMAESGMDKMFFLRAAQMVPYLSEWDPRTMPPVAWSDLDVVESLGRVANLPHRQFLLAKTSAHFNSTQDATVATLVASGETFCGAPLHLLDGQVLKQHVALLGTLSSCSADFYRHLLRIVDVGEESSRWSAVTVRALGTMVAALDPHRLQTLNPHTVQFISTDAVSRMDKEQLQIIHPQLTVQQLSAIPQPVLLSLDPSSQLAIQRRQRGPNFEQYASQPAAAASAGATQQPETGTHIERMPEVAAQPNDNYVLTVIYIESSAAFTNSLSTMLLICINVSSFNFRN